MNYFPNNGYGLHRAIYLSRAVAGQDEGAVAAIVAKSAANNRARSVTGALIAYDGWFLQALEGSCETLKPLFDLIAADPRHCDVMLKSVAPVEKRVFARWGMKQGQLPDASVLDIQTADADVLLSILKLSVLAPAARAA